MKIAIIGGKGYIGSFLYKNLASYYDTTVYDIHNNALSQRGCNISRDEIQQYDVVIYLAGLTGRVSCFHHTKDEIWTENIDDIMTVGRNMNKNQLLIYASSATLLEGSNDIPASEDYQIQLNLLDPYGMSMYHRERKIYELDIPTIGLRFGTVIGISPKQRHDLVYVTMLRSAFLKGEIHIQNPQCYRPILWIHDLFHAIKTICLTYDNNADHINNDKHKIYNLASFNINIETIAQSIHQKTKVPIIIDKDNGISGYSLNTDQFCEAYNFTFLGTSEKILTELIEHIGHICIENTLTENTCRVCKHSNTVPVIDMAQQPLANNYVEAPSIQSEYPLCLIRCKDCFHTQLNYTVRPEVMFKNYQYVSGTSYTLRKYFAELAQKCIRDTGYDKGTVLELACNDGSQLDEFAKLGWKTFGVDPAQNVVIEGQEKGHHICCGFWGVEDFPDIPTPDLIIAQNVVAHVPDPVQFMKHCARIMKEHTYLYIQTSQCNMYRNGEFDTIYHEHLSFFTIASMMKAAELCGLIITEITKQPIHGTSYLFQMRVNISGKETHSIQAKSMYNEEMNTGLYTDVFFTNYTERVMKIKNWVLSTIADFKNKGIPIVGYGAAAKGMTLLNFFDIQGIEYIVDDATMKHNKYTPGKNIIIVPPNKLGEDRRILAIFVFAWNFIDEILEKIKKIRNELYVDTYIIQPFPEQITYHIHGTSE